MSAKKKRILLVEDEPHLAFNLELNLTQEGYEVVVAKDGVEALQEFFKNGPFHLIMLDVMLPEPNGFEVAKAIRKSDTKTGILLLTACASDEDIISGLQTGADDYITKPFRLNEVLLRVKRMARRSDFYREKSETNRTMLWQHGKISLNMESLELNSPKGRYRLTVLEANVLKEFLRYPETILTREYLLETVWDMNGSIETRTVDNFIMRLRRYIEYDPSKPVSLESIRGKGYRLL